MKYILFVCTHNAGRSQMAQAFWRRHAPADVRAESAGQVPAKAAWPEVVEAMAEVGIDISHERPKKLDLEMQLHADWAITLGCGGACPYVPTRVDDWEITDPHGQPMDVVREIRDDLERRIVDFIATRLDEIRSDRTAHQLRLVRMLPDLDREFGRTHPADRSAPAPIRCSADMTAPRFAAWCRRSPTARRASVSGRTAARTSSKPERADGQSGAVSRGSAPTA